MTQAEAMDPGANHFQLFALPVGFAIDAAVLDQAYRELQGRVHPDKFAHRPDAERRLSMQWATQANEAYRTLKRPLTRAQYLLHLHGVDVGAESNTAMPADFLIEQMEWREAVEEARQGGDHHELEHLHLRLQRHLDERYAALAMQLDEQQDHRGAAESVRKLMFLERLAEEIDDSLAAIEDN
jgi:molecular chaperone HscB